MELCYSIQTIWFLFHFIHSASILSASAFLPLFPSSSLSSSLSSSSLSSSSISTEDAGDVNLVDLLCTCVRAARRGCFEIRRVNSGLTRSEDGKIADKSTSISTVDYKIANDPRSALTAADLAAQSAVIGLIESEWPTLKIVGEEDLSCDVASDATGEGVCASDLAVPSTILVDAAQKIIKTDTVEGKAPEEVEEDREIAELRRELITSVTSSPANTTSFTVPANDVTIFVDPLDGTREFVEGRIRNVQTLIGVSVRGMAVAGAVGLPFAVRGDTANNKSSNENDDNYSMNAAVVCGLVGAGPPRVVGERAPPTDVIHGGGVPDHGDRPLLVAGDVEDPALVALYDSVLSFNGVNDGSGRRGRSILLGGTGQKCLAVAEGRADVAVMNFKSSSWDTCAPEALVRAAGGEVTDVFGEKIVHRADPTEPATYLNACGVVVTSREFRDLHREVCDTMRKNFHAQKRLRVWGLSSGDIREGGNIVDESAIGDVLRDRQRRLLAGL